MSCDLLVLPGKQFLNDIHFPQNAGTENASLLPVLCRRLWWNYPWTLKLQRREEGRIPEGSIPADSCGAIVLAALISLVACLPPEVLPIP